MKNHFLALLRGINVGGKNIIRMTDLKECFENIGFTDVLTFIQSGNVLFYSEISDKKKLTIEIQKKLSERFNYDQPVFIVSEKELKEIIEKSPAGFGKEPDKFRYDVIFLKEPLKAKETLMMVPAKEGVDRTYAGEHVLYFSRLASKASQSKLNRIISLPIYQQMTIRNWNTTTRLHSLMQNKRK